MVAYFTLRATATAVLAGAVALVGVFVLRADARYLFDGLTSRALPFVIASAVCGGASLVLVRREGHGVARLLAVGAVAGVVAGWGVAQWPYILPESLTVADAAAPSGTLVALLVATLAGLVTVLPGFVLLYVLDQRGLLPDEGMPLFADAGADP